MSEKPAIPKWKRRLKRLGWITLALLILGGIAFLLRAPILTAVANAWIVHEPDFEWVDAVVVPGGGLNTRPFQAAKLFHEGKTDTIVTFRTETAPTTEIGITPAHHQQNVGVLVALEVPSASISVIGERVTSTWEEVKACRDWCEEQGHKTIAIMTEIFPSKRVRWAYEQGFDNADTKIFVSAIEPRLYAADSWWQNESGVVAFQNEVIKYVYYRLKY